MDSFDAETREEILRLMPEISEEAGAGYGRAARRSLKSYESRALLDA